LIFVTNQTDAVFSQLEDMEGAAGALAGSVTGTEATATVRTPGFDEAFTLYHRVVYRTARSVVQDEGLAEDVTQEVFLRFYRHQKSVPEGELLRAWLLRVALNVARNTVRGNTRAAHREENYAREQPEFFPAPEEEYERRAQIKAARDTLERIKEPLRSCLLLKQQGLSYKEIAETLSLNETSVGQYVARGRKEFVRLYGKIGGRHEGMH
jgi:RNA polymerase sigma factor (sigma-70 family)